MGSEEDQSEEERLALERLDQERSICRKQIKGHSSLSKFHVDQRKKIQPWKSSSV